MTSLSRILAGFAFLSLAAPCGAHAAPRTPRQTLAYVPGAIWGAHLEAATGELGLQRFAIYWFDGSDDMGRVLGDVERYLAEDAKAAPLEPMVAFVGRFATYPSNTLLPGVAVMDTTGAMLADFPRGRSFAWSPDGTRLAVVFEREPMARAARRGKSSRAARPVRYRPGVTVWDRRDGKVRSFHQWPSRVAWAGDDSLLLQLSDSVAAIDLRSGNTVATRYRGALLSPDGRYALRPGEGDQDTRIFYQNAEAAIDADVFGPFRKRDLGQIRSAFWVRARGADHLMCVSACDAIQQSSPSCRTDVIDVATLDVVGSFRGEALGPTADERGVVVFRRGRGRLEFHDLRPVARERREPERPDHGDEESGEFY